MILCGIQDKVLYSQDDIVIMNVSREDNSLLLGSHDSLNDTVLIC